MSVIQLNAIQHRNTKENDIQPMSVIQLNDILLSDTLLIVELLIALLISFIWLSGILLIVIWSNDLAPFFPDNRFNMCNFYFL